MLRRRNQLTQKLENFVSSSIRSLTFLEFPGEISAYALAGAREKGLSFFFLEKGFEFLISATIVKLFCVRYSLRSDDENYVNMKLEY